MNGGAVITNHDQKLKIGHVFGDAVMPKFAINNFIKSFHGFLPPVSKA